MNHEWLSIKLNRHFSDYFVYLARHSTNKWGDFLTVQKAIVENYPSLLTPAQDLVYAFKATDPQPSVAGGLPLWAVTLIVLGSVAVVWGAIAIYVTKC